MTKEEEHEVYGKCVKCCCEYKNLQVILVFCSQCLPYRYTREISTPKRIAAMFPVPFTELFDER